VLIIDYFTKAAEFYTIYSKKPQAVAEAFYYAWICRYGNCEVVTSDNGGEFAKEFAHMLARLGVQHMHTSACHPAANGAVERLVRSFKEIIAKFVNDHPVHWVRAIPQARMAYMSRVHRAIGVSPFEMLHGCSPMLAVPAAFAIGSLAVSDEYDIEEYVASLKEHFQALDNQALTLIEQQFKRNQQDWQIFGLISAENKSIH